MSRFNRAYELQRVYYFQNSIKMTTSQAHSRHFFDAVIFPLWGALFTYRKMRRDCRSASSRHFSACSMPRTNIHIRPFLASDIAFTITATELVWVIDIAVRLKYFATQLAMRLAAILRRFTQFHTGANNTNATYYDTQDDLSYRRIKEVYRAASVAFTAFAIFSACDDGRRRATSTHRRSRDFRAIADDASIFCVIREFTFEISLQQAYWFSMILQENNAKWPPQTPQEESRPD